MEGVVRAPSAFSMTRGLPPSSTATQELVVPKSMPIIFPIVSVLLELISSFAVVKTACIILSHMGVTTFISSLAHRERPPLASPPRAATPPPWRGGSDGRSRYNPFEERGAPHWVRRRGSLASPWPGAGPDCTFRL